MTDFPTLIRSNSSESTPYFHVVGFKFPDTVGRETQADLMVSCQALHAACGGVDAGILKFAVTPNVDQRKGYTWIEFGFLRNRDAFSSFHAHPAHQDFAKRIALFADVWVVLDTDQLGSWFMNNME